MNNVISMLCKRAAIVVVVVLCCWQPMQAQVWSTQVVPFTSDETQRHDASPSVDASLFKFIEEQVLPGLLGARAVHGDMDPLVLYVRDALSSDASLKALRDEWIRAFESESSTVDDVEAQIHINAWVSNSVDRRDSLVRRYLNHEITSQKSRCFGILSGVSVSAAQRYLAWLWKGDVESGVLSKSQTITNFSTSTIICAEPFSTTVGSAKFTVISTVETAISDTLEADSQALKDQIIMSSLYAAGNLGIVATLPMFGNISKTCRSDVGLQASIGGDLQKRTSCVGSMRLAAGFEYNPHESIGFLLNGTLGAFFFTDELRSRLGINANLSCMANVHGLLRVQDIILQASFVTTFDQRLFSTPVVFSVSYVR